jgi:hypothetical protein
MTPDQIARLLVSQLEDLSPDSGARYAHGTPVPAPSKAIAEHAAHRAYELARELHPGGLADDRRYSFHVEREGSAWQVVTVIVSVP